MMKSRASLLSDAFLAWARRSAIPVPGSQEEPLCESAQAALNRMLAGKRFVFLGEPEHCITEKYPFRLTFIRCLFARGWRHVGMETGRSVGWRVDRYLETGEESRLLVGSPGSRDAALHRRTLEFIDVHENPFHRQLRGISESRAPGTPRLHYRGFDLDIGVPLGAVEPIKSLLQGRADQCTPQLLDRIDGLVDLSTEEQMARIEDIERDLASCDDVCSGGLRSWLRFLQESIAAEKRPREAEDLRGHCLWRAERERLMMRYLDEIVDALGPDGRLILMGHYGHLCKDASHLYFRPQRSRFWGFRSYLRALGYEAYSRLRRCPLSNEAGSVGSHLHQRFPRDVLSIWMLYGEGTLMMPAGPRTVRLHGDTIESLLAQVGDRFLLPLQNADAQARMILAHANLRSAQGLYASADLTAQAEALYFVRSVNAE